LHETRTCRISLDPNYSPDTLYPLTKLLCLIYDEVCLWYPVQPLLARHLSPSDFLELVDMGAICPIGESSWWEKESRRKWPDFAGEWHDVDKYIAAKDLYIPFSFLIGDENEYKAEVEDRARISVANFVMRNALVSSGERPYSYVLRSRDLAEWFASCFWAHRGIAKALRSYELVAENHEKAWQILFERLARDEVKEHQEEFQSFAGIQLDVEQLIAVTRFLDDMKLRLPANLSTKEIQDFREEPCAQRFRDFLARAHAVAQEGAHLTLDSALVEEFQKMADAYAKGRRLAVFTVETMIAGPSLWFASVAHPGLGGLVGFTVGAIQNKLHFALEHLWDSTGGQLFSRYSWVLQLRRRGPGGRTL